MFRIADADNEPVGLSLGTAERIDFPDLVSEDVPLLEARKVRRRVRLCAPRTGRRGWKAELASCRVYCRRSSWSSRSWRRR